VVLAGFFPEQGRRYLSPLWRVLDRIYNAAAVIAAGFLVIILLLIVAGIAVRWASGFFPGSTTHAGYAMAATSFFALAYTLTRGGHIRVSLFLNLTNGTRFWLDAFAMLVAAITATYFARFAIKTTQFSKMLRENTQGQDLVPEWFITLIEMLGSSPTQWSEMWANAGDQWVPTPIWLPQIPMSIGAILLAVALWDYLSRLLVNRKTAIVGEAVE
jgi:TRAP-type C4-dicarboxylate transport system permease small subunit